MVSGTLVVVAVKLGVLLVRVAVLPMLNTVLGVVVLGLAWKVTVPLVPAFTVPRFQVKVCPLILHELEHEFATYSKLVSRTSVMVAVLKFALPVLLYGMVYVTTSSFAAPLGWS